MELNKYIISDVLDLLCVNYPTKGYGYLAQGIRMCLGNKDFMMNDLYELLQNESGVTKGAASMALDYAMRVSQSNCSEDDWKTVFRVDNRKKGRMKPSTYIFGVARYLEREIGGVE